MIEVLYVFSTLDQTTVLVGTLSVRPNGYSFTYHEDWIKVNGYPLDPKNLPLIRGPISGIGRRVHGVFEDAGPDSWGRHLMEVNGRNAADPLERLRLCNGHGTGSLLFSQSRTKPNATRSILVRADIDDLNEIVHQIDSGSAVSNEALNQLLAGGSGSLGGARPKAIISMNGDQWIAKFERASDTICVPKTEYAAMTLARLCGLNVAECELLTAKNRSVLLVKRFDRPAGERSHYLSAHSLLALNSISPRDMIAPTGRATYVNLVANAKVLKTDIGHELFSRMVFNILIGNTDDHLRNHGFLLDNRLWRLAPAFDITILGGGEQSLGVGSFGRVRSIENALSCADGFGLSASTAQNIVDYQTNVIEENINNTLESAGIPLGHQAVVWRRLFLGSARPSHQAKPR